MRSALRFLLVTAGLATLTIVGTVVALSWNPGADVHTPRGYELLAQLFQRHGWLSFDEQSTRVDLTATVDQAVSGVFRRSFLQNDVEAFNGGDRSIFKIDNRQILALDATRHNVVLPYGSIERWAGTLRYRPTGQRTASLRGVGIDLELRGLTAPVLDHVSPAEVTIRGDLTAEPLSAATGEVINVFGAPRVYLGKFYVAADKIVVNHRNAPALMAIAVDGRRLPQGNHAWVGPGDLLKLEWRPADLRPTRYALLWNEGGQSADAISSPCAINGRWDRCPEEPAFALAGDIVATLDGGVAAGTSGARADFDVVLTLDRQLNRSVQTALERNRRPPRGSTGNADPVNRAATRAAVTVMDALTGDVLALASYPTRTALARFDLSGAARARLLRNHNFSRMSIGSVAKVLLAAAIIDADPRLVSLQLRQHAGETVDNVAGIHIDPPIESHPVATGGDPLVDFREFIQHSSNEYAALLLTLASVTRRGAPLPAFSGPLLPPEGRYTIDGRVFDRAPSVDRAGETRLNLGRGPGGTIVAGTLSHLEGEAWGDSFRRLFDVDTIVSTPIEGRPAAAGDQVVDTTVWTPVLEYLYGTAVPGNHPMRAVGFERESLALNVSHQYRTQLLSLMYGGAAARFTNPKLCEMFSRLVTGRRVDRSLVFGVTAPGEEPRPQRPRVEPLDFQPGVRSQLLDAMAGVAQRGTASALHDTLVRIDRDLSATGRALGFFSKTGSPRNTVSVPSGLSRAINALISSGAVALNQHDALLYRGMPVSDDAERRAVAPSLQALLDHAADRAVLRRYGVGPRLVHDVLRLYNIEPPDRRTQLFVVNNGRLYSMLRTREIPTTGAVFVFTFGVYDAAARRSQTPLDIDAVRHVPQRAWTVAVTIEGQGKSTDVAVPFAETLIAEVIWPALRQHVIQ